NPLSGYTALRRTHGSLEPRERTAENDPPRYERAVWKSLHRQLPTSLHPLDLRVVRRDAQALLVRNHHNEGASQDSSQLVEVRDELGPTLAFNRISELQRSKRSNQS